MSQTVSALCLAGPTASGKSSLALRLAKDFPVGLINTDSLQIYRDLPLLTAFPSKKDQGLCPHYLYGFLKAEERFSVASWLKKAEEAYQNCLNKGLFPVFVGGTGLYFKALLEGLVCVPNIKNEIRQSLQKALSEEGSQALHKELAFLCPEEGKRLHPNDTTRVLRSLEVLKSTEKPLSWWQSRPGQPLFLKTKPFVALFLPERSHLYCKAEKRFDAMMQEGALAEVQNLLNTLTTEEGGQAKNRVLQDLPVSKALGAKELAAVLEGDCSLEHALIKAKQETRNYIKRQFTWFRHQLKADLTLDQENLDQQYEALKAALGVGLS